MDFKNSPSFFVIGAQRSGTTRLCSLLDAHPEVGIPSKEPFYFQSPAAMAEKHDWYRGLFAEARGSIFGEGSTYYSMCGKYPETAARIAAFDPSARVIYIVRHPLRRMESAWNHLLSVGHLSSLADFKRTLMSSEELVDPSLYSRQLSEYRAAFPDEQIHLCFFEEFVRSELNVLNGCLRFLGIDEVERLPLESTAELNASEGMTQQWRVIDAIKAAPGYSSLKRLVPQSVKTALTDGLRVAIPRPRWDDELVEYAIARVASDAEAFLTHAGKPLNYWKLAEIA